MNRLGLSSEEFYGMSPAEFYYALEDWEDTHSYPMRNICETLRLHGVLVYNSAFGRKRQDVIHDPKSLFTFGWEKPPKVAVKSVEEMKAAVLGIAQVFDKTRLKRQKNTRGN